MSNMKKVVFLCSGGGGNLRFIQNCIFRGRLPHHEIVGVFVDRECEALKYADKYGLPSRKLIYSRQQNQDLLDCLERTSPDLIVTNFHKILDVELVKRFDGKLINLHYSLLPAFKGTIGARSLEQALEAGCKFVGATSHFVEEEVDSGKIICQGVFPVVEDQPFPAVMNKMFRIGCLVLLNSIHLVGNNVGSKYRFFADIGGLSGYFSPPLAFESDFFNEQFWTDL